MQDQRPPKGGRRQRGATREAATFRWRVVHKQIVREKCIPLNLSYERELPQETAGSLDEAKRILAKGKPRFATADQMFDSLGI